MNLAIALLCASSPAVAASPAADALVGSVKTVKGDVTVSRASGQRSVPETGTQLYARDVLHTGKNGAVGIILMDETSLALGPSSELSLKEFVYQPKEGLFSSVVHMARGTLVYISGRIARLAPGAVKVETPVGIAAVRGTRFMVKVED